MMLCLWVYIVSGKKLIDWMNPSSNSSLIDVASGTGDIAKLFLNGAKICHQSLV